MANEKLNGCKVAILVDDGFEQVELTEPRNALERYHAASSRSEERIGNAMDTTFPCSIPGKESRVYRRPVGVVGVISPWDFSLQLTNRSVAPALASAAVSVLRRVGAGEPHW